MNIVEFLKKRIDSIGTICAKYLNENNEIEYLPIFYIAGSQTLPPPLEPAEEEKMIKRTYLLTILLIVCLLTGCGNKTESFEKTENWLRFLGGTKAGDA